MRLMSESGGSMHLRGMSTHRLGYSLLGRGLGMRKPLQLLVWFLMLFSGIRKRRRPGFDLKCIASCAEYHSSIRHSWYIHVHTSNQSVLTNQSIMQTNQQSNQEKKRKDYFLQNINFPTFLLTLQLTSLMRSFILAPPLYFSAALVAAEPVELGAVAILPASNLVFPSTSF